MRRWFQTFALFTIGIIFITGFFIWLTYRDEITTLSHVPDSDWSDSYKVTPELRENSFASIVDDQGKIHTLWLEYHPPYGAADLVYFNTEAKGKKRREEAQILASNNHMDSYMMTQAGDKIHILYAGQGAPDEVDLHYIQLNLAGEIQTTNLVATNLFTDLRDLQAYPTPEGNLMLIWTDRVGFYRQIKTMLVDQSGQMINKPLQLTNTESHGRTPRLVIDEKGRYHLAWREEFATHYTLFYQQLNAQGEGINTPRAIDYLSVNAPSIGIYEDSVYLVWAKRMKPVGLRTTIIEKSFANYELFGTVIDLNQPEQKLQIQRLTAQNGPSYDHTMQIDAEGKVHLIYVDTYHNHLGLTHRIFQEDFLHEVKEARRLYPNQVSGSQTQLFQDSKGELHLIWLEASKDSGYVFYANTIYAKKANPLEVVGLNSGHYGVSLFMSLFYLLAVPIFFILLHFHWGTIIILAGFVNNICNTLASKEKIGTYLKMPVVKTGLVCLIHALLYLVFGKAAWLFGTDLPAISQIWFIMILATVATLGLVALTQSQFHRFGATQVGFHAFIWIFWVHLITLTYSLPLVNFFFDLVDLSGLGA